MANDQPAVVALKGIAAQRRSYRVEFTCRPLSIVWRTVMGEGVTRVVATDRKGTRVRTLSHEIAQMRIRLTAVLTELDRRRHNATVWKHLARAHAGAVAAGALVLAAVVGPPGGVLKVRGPRQRRGGG